MPRAIRAIKDRAQPAPLARHVPVQLQVMANRLVAASQKLPPSLMATAGQAANHAVVLRHQEIYNSM